MTAFLIFQKPFRAWYFIIAFIGVVTVVLIRDYGVFFQPKFLVEDGKVFFADAFNLPFYYSVTQPYAGYYHLVPRLLAEAAQFAPSPLLLYFIVDLLYLLMHFV